jgi:hypothetical protein
MKEQEVLAGEIMDEWLEKGYVLIMSKVNDRSYLGQILSRSGEEIAGRIGTTRLHTLILLDTEGHIAEDEGACSERS